MKQNYLPASKCKDGYLYLIKARNSFLGISTDNGKKFIISRTKFSSNFLDEEDHWDTEHESPFSFKRLGTVKPLKELEKVPESIELLKYLNNKIEYYKNVC